VPTSDTRERIVSAAARLFLERSYQSVGIDEICVAADARKGSFYYHFSSKGELAKAVVDRHAVTFAARLTEFADDDPVHRLRAIPDMIGAIQSEFESQFGRAVGCPFGNLAAELSTTDDTLRAHIAQFFAVMEEGLALLCRQAAERGALREGVDPDHLAHLLLAQYQGVTLLAKLNNVHVAGISAALHDFFSVYLTESPSAPRPLHPRGYLGDSPSRAS
jgi:TetR/AcrR family transcriptional regulator, transcriptional repressor for nem operon